MKVLFLVPIRGNRSTERSRHLLNVTQAEEWAEQGSGDRQSGFQVCALRLHSVLQDQTSTVGLSWAEAAS